MASSRSDAAHLLEHVAGGPGHDGRDERLVVGVGREHHAGDLRRAATGPRGTPRRRCRRAAARREWPRRASWAGSAPRLRPPCQLRPRPRCRRWRRAGHAGPVRTTSWSSRRKTPQAHRPILPPPARLPPGIAQGDPVRRACGKLHPVPLPFHRGSDQAAPGARSDPAHRVEPRAARGAPPCRRGGSIDDRRPLWGARCAQRGQAVPGGLHHGRAHCRRGEEPSAPSRRVGVSSDCSSQIPQPLRVRPRSAAIPRASASRRTIRR